MAHDSLPTIYCIISNSRRSAGRYVADMPSVRYAWMMMLADRPEVGSPMRRAGEASQKLPARSRARIEVVVECQEVGTSMSPASICRRAPLTSGISHKAEWTSLGLKTTMNAAIRVTAADIRKTSCIVVIMFSFSFPRGCLWSACPYYLVTSYR